MLNILHKTTYEDDIEAYVTSELFINTKLI
jgi:hypothetical protein